MHWIFWIGFVGFLEHWFLLFFSSGFFMKVLRSGSDLFVSGLGSGRRNIEMDGYCTQDERHLLSAPTQNAPRNLGTRPTIFSTLSKVSGYAMPLCTVLFFTLLVRCLSPPYVFIYFLSSQSTPRYPAPHDIITLLLHGQTMFKVALFGFLDRTYIIGTYTSEIIIPSSTINNSFDLLRNEGGEGAMYMKRPDFLTRGSGAYENKNGDITVIEVHENHAKWLSSERSIPVRRQWHAACSRNHTNMS